MVTNITERAKMDLRTERFIYSAIRNGLLVKKQQTPSELYRVGLSSGSYRKLDPRELSEHVQVEIIPDPHRILHKVATGTRVSAEEHADLLKKISDMGYTRASQNVAIGPAVDAEGHVKPDHLLLVYYQEHHR